MSDLQTPGIYRVGFDDDAQCTLIAFNAHDGLSNSYDWLWPEDAAEFVERASWLPERIRPILARKCREVLDSLQSYLVDCDPGDEA